MPEFNSDVDQIDTGCGGGGEDSGKNCDTQQETQQTSSLIVYDANSNIIYTAALDADVVFPIRAEIQDETAVTITTQTNAGAPTQVHQEADDSALINVKKELVEITALYDKMVDESRTCVIVNNRHRHIPFIGSFNVPDMFPF